MESQSLLLGESLLLWFLLQPVWGDEPVLPWAPAAEPQAGGQALQSVFLLAIRGEQIYASSFFPKAWFGWGLVMTLNLLSEERPFNAVDMRIIQDHTAGGRSPESV